MRGSPARLTGRVPAAPYCDARRLPRPSPDDTMPAPSIGSTLDEADRIGPRLTACPRVGRLRSRGTHPGPSAVRELSLEANSILGAIVIGVGATVLLDLWNLFLKRGFGIPSLSYCLLGRWLRHMLEGTLRHASITAAPRKPLECTVGWIAHYTIGVGFALVFVAITSGDWLARPTVLPALLYGIGTVVFPFFIMQPSFGLGIAASRTPNPTQARLKSLATHTVFGVGLYACALGLRFALRGHA